jgi:C-terminal processing protease CtpA/Prc
VFVPTAKLVYPDGRDLEGIGVTPDVTVALSREDLLSGIDTQMRAAVDLLRSMRDGDSTGIEGG